MLKVRKERKAKQVKLILYFHRRYIAHNYSTSLTFCLNRKRIISIYILVLYEHLISFTQSLRVFWIYASLRNAQLVRKEEALYLRFFTQELKMRKFWISSCVLSQDGHASSSLVVVPTFNVIFQAFCCFIYNYFCHWSSHFDLFCCKISSYFCCWLLRCELFVNVTLLNIIPVADHFNPSELLFCGIILLCTLLRFK